MNSFNSRPKVAVIFGGKSGEHQISCLTAREVLRTIDRGHYDPTPIGITQSGEWVRETTDWDEVAGQLPQVRADAPPFSIEELASFDVVFPLLHGPWGEDGTIQGLCEMLGLRYVGAGVLASAVGMDKSFTKTLFSAAGLPQLHYVVVRAGDWEKRRDRIVGRLESLGLPLFVKPARGGSSEGVTLVTSLDQLDGALEKAHEFDPKVIVESAATEKRELECGVIQRPDGSVMASVVGEITVIDSTHEFYDFEAKYLDGSGLNIVPADITEDLSERIRVYAIKAFQAIGGEGLARVDFFLSGSELVINEINTMPGFTKHSMFPLLWQASGIEYADLIDQLLTQALNRTTGLR